MWVLFQSLPPCWGSFRHKGAPSPWSRPRGSLLLTPVIFHQSFPGQCLPSSFPQTPLSDKGVQTPPLPLPNPTLHSLTSTPLLRYFSLPSLSPPPHFCLPSSARLSLPGCRELRGPRDDTHSRGNHLETVESARGGWGGVHGCLPCALSCPLR